MKECHELIDKVSEFRHSKVKQRQINKFNRLIIKDGNITCSGSQNAQASAAPWQPGLVHPRQVAPFAWQLELVLPRQVAASPTS